jgi:hypothetical protein
MLPALSSTGVADAQSGRPVELVSAVCHFTEPSWLRATSRPSTPSIENDTVVT